jgi:hypothetical protein
MKHGALVNIPIMYLFCANFVHATKRTALSVQLHSTYISLRCKICI